LKKKIMLKKYIMYFVFLKLSIKYSFFFFFFFFFYNIKKVLQIYWKINEYWYINIINYRNKIKMRWLQLSSATLLLASAVKAWEWDWATSGEASMTHVRISI